MKHLRIALGLATLLCRAAWAGPADYVYTPAVEYGEREIDFKYGSAGRSGDPRQQAASIGFGYGATESWFTEVYLKYEKTSPDGVRFDAVEWENKFQLTETGKYFVDVGVITEIEVPTDRSEGYEFKVGPLFQTEVGKLQLNANILLERQVRTANQTGPQLGYQWQVKYRWLPAFEYGLQGFGEVGQWNDWAPAEERTHRLGPAVFGKIALGGRQAIRYNAAWLFGAAGGAADHTFRLQAEYEF